jgi:hypothetical protein
MAGALLCVTSLSSLAQAGPVNRISREIDSSQMTRLSGNVNPHLRTAADLGRANGAARLNGVSMFFAPSARQRAALQALLAGQHDPNSPNYHQWITPEEYADRFGMSAQDMAKITAWLQGQGLKVDSVNRTRDRIFFSGTTSRIESVFQTEFHRYMVNGENHFANARELSVPSALAGTVLGFRNLDDFRLKPRVRTLSPRFTSSISGNTYLAPADVATIYNLNGLYAAGFDGTGQTIAVAGQTLIKLSDVNNFRAAAGLSVNPPQLVLLPGSGAAQVSTSDEVESDLDVEWSGALAPNAKIIFVFAGNSRTKDVRDALFYAVDNSLAPVVSMSYGLCELDANLSGDLVQFQAEAQKANSFGMTITAASGDAGATDCEASTATIAIRGLSVDVPATLQEVTGVGGTMFTGDSGAGQATYWNATNNSSNQGSAKGYIPETTWNDAFGSATGGGVSTVVVKPAYQTALTPADGHRDVPDVALSASPSHDGYLICDLDNSDATHGGACNSGFRDTSTSLLFPAGGTSFGAPEFAAIISLIDQATENAAGSANINPTLYSLAGQSSIYTAAFHDIKTGDNRQLCQGGSTGCTSANSHTELAQERSGLWRYAGLFLIPLGAVVMYSGRRRGGAALGMLLVVCVISIQIACGGGSSNNNNPPPPPPNLMIGWSAGTNYDLVTGLGSVDAFALAGNWPFFTSSPSAAAFALSANPAAISMNANTPGNSTITLTRPSGSFSGTVTLTCVATGDVNGDPPPTCSLSASSVALSASAQTGSSKATVNSSKAGTYLVTVTGVSQTGIAHVVTVPVTVN